MTFSARKARRIYAWSSACSRGSRRLGRSPARPGARERSAGGSADVPLTSDAAVFWYRLVRPLENLGRGRDAVDRLGHHARASLQLFELQHAIDYLDHAPAGFFSRAGRRDILSKRHLAGWLDYDLAQFGSGGLQLTDIVAAGGVALIDIVRPRTGRGEDRTIRRRPQAPGALRPCASCIASPIPDGRPALRAAGDQSPKGEERPRTCAPRENYVFARFFNSTPMASPGQFRAAFWVERGLRPARPSGAAHLPSPGRPLDLSRCRD